MKISKHQNTGFGFGAIFCIVAIVGLAAPTRANELVGRDIAVSYHDLEIDTEQGASQLLKRIELAANRICAPLDERRLTARANAMRCQQEVTAYAVARVNHPMLLAVYESAHGVPQPVAGIVKQ
jgi:UrcA family protein